MFKNIKSMLKGGGEKSIGEYLQGGLINLCFTKFILMYQEGKENEKIKHSKFNDFIQSL